MLRVLSGERICVRAVVRSDIVATLAGALGGSRFRLWVGGIVYNYSG